MGLGLCPPCDLLRRPDIFDHCFDHLVRRAGQVPNLGVDNWNHRSLPGDSYDARSDLAIGYAWIGKLPGLEMIENQNPYAPARKSNLDS